MAAAQPSFEELLELRKHASLVPITREVLADALTPVGAYASLGGGEGSFLLESVVGGEKWGRYSFVGFDPDLRVRGRASTFEVRSGSLSSGRVETKQGVDPWAELRALMRTFAPPPHEAISFLPRFWGGAVGYVAYDAVRAFEPSALRSEREASTWDFSFAIGGTLVVFDDLRKTARIVVTLRSDVPDARAAYDDAVARLDAAEARLFAAPRLRPMAPPERAPSQELPPSSFDRARYGDAVRRIHEHILEGDIFQAVLSQRFRLPAAGIDAFDVYRAMRVINPSPYMYFLRFAEARVAGASPESLVRLENGRAEVRPLAGTRRRGASAEEDSRIGEELLADPKERAEHVMLVDLGRNDLGRVCKPGTVKVTEEMAIERYSHVMHVVSNVCGEIADDRDAIDVLAAVFPAGTLSGAPKVRAMQILDELEPEPRGIYGGAVGYIGWDGNLDAAIAIRTLVEQDGELRIQAGAGIVEASEPDYEYDETVSKARAALAAALAAGAGRR